MLLFMPQQRPDPRQQIAQRKRLCDVVVGSEIEAKDPVRLDGPGRQHQIENHQLRGVLAEGAVSALPVSGREDLVRFEFQVILQPAQDGRIVLDDENAAHASYFAARCLGRKFSSAHSSVRVTTLWNNPCFPSG